MRLSLYLLRGHSSKTAVWGAQSAKLFLRIGTPPTPDPLANVPPPPWFGGGGTLACGSGGGVVPIPTRRQTLRYSRYLCTVLCGWEKHRWKNKRSEKTWRTEDVNTQRRKDEREEGQVAVRLELADRGM